MSEELNPCPFCGGEQFTVTHHTTCFDGAEQWTIYCQGCHTTSGIYPKDEAFKKWNTRKRQTLKLKKGR